MDLLVLCGMDQLPESRSMVVSEAWPGDFSAGAVGFMPAVRVDIEGRVCDEVVTGWVSGGPQGR